MFAILDILKQNPGDLTVNEICCKLITNNQLPATPYPITFKKRVIYQLKILAQNKQIILTKTQTRIKTPIYFAKFKNQLQPNDNWITNY